ncbi:MAG: long-chain fatty acid--CoA ligase [Chloroflexi bacterium]|nr:long-chain fatty acid--CoA ligase [Chloroflexota bacterium]
MQLSKNMELDTIPKLLFANYRKHPGEVALREKRYGVWNEFTWKDYFEKVKYFALGLLALGLKRGDRVSIIGENKPEWFCAELASQTIGGIVVGIYTDAGPLEVAHFAGHSGSRIVVAHDQEQVDKLLQIQDKLPQLEKVIYWDDRGLWNYDDPLLISYDQVLELGRKYEKEHRGIFEEEMKKGSGNDLAVISYTSGTTGLPKGAMISHRQLITLAQLGRDLDNWTDSDEYVSFVPPAWITEQCIGITGCILSRMKASFAESPESIQENIREIGASVLFYGPRNWESVVRMVQARISDAHPFKRFLYGLFLPVGYKVADIRLAKNQPRPLWRSLCWIAHVALFRQLLDKLGFSKVRTAYTAGSAISPDILRFFHAIGVSLKNMYGASEIGTVSSHTDDDIRPETAGFPLEGIEVRISGESEILVKSKTLFDGYYKDDEGTRKKLRNGWYYTGDFGHIDESGHVIVMDRMDDLRSLASGQKFSPQYTEIRLRFSPYIKEAIVVGGEERDYVTTIINIELNNVGKWAERKRIPYTTFSDLSQREQVLKLIAGEVMKVNRTLPEWARIKKFTNLNKELDADEAEMTRTRKLRRTFVEEKYSYLIQALYSDKSELPMESEVVYRDGRRAKTTTSIRINAVETR